MFRSSIEAMGNGLNADQETPANHQVRSVTNDRSHGNEDVMSK